MPAIGMAQKRTKLIVIITPPIKGITLVSKEGRGDKRVEAICDQFVNRLYANVTEFRQNMIPEPPLEINHRFSGTM